MFILFFFAAGHSWNTMVEAIQAHIGSLNWGYRVALREKKVNYLNAFAEFVDPHTLKVNKLSCIPIILRDLHVLLLSLRSKYISDY